MKIRITSFTLVALVLTAVFLVAYWLLILPQFRALATAQQQLEATTQSNISSLGGGTQSKRQQEVAALKTQAETLLPTTDKQYDLSVQLEAAAKNSNVTLVSIAINSGDLQIPQTSGAAASAAAAGPVKKLSLALAVSGSYANCQGFLKAITSLDRFIQLNAVGVTSGSATADQVNLQINGVAYFLPAASN